MEKRTKIFLALFFTCVCLSNQSAQAMQEEHVCTGLEGNQENMMMVVAVERQEEPEVVVEAPFERTVPLDRQARQRKIETIRELFKREFRDFFEQTSFARDLSEEELENDPNNGNYSEDAELYNFSS